MKMKRANSPHIITFVNQLALVLDSDLPVHQGLEIMASKTESLKIKDIILDVQDQMKSGETLGQALKSHENFLSPFVTQMIILGEDSGNLVFALNEISNTLEKDNAISEKVKSALTYPIILFVLMLGVMALLIVKILPTFESILSNLGGEMPGITVILLNFGKSVSSNIVWILLVLAVLGIMGYYGLKSEKGKYLYHRLLFKLPFVKSIVASLYGYKLSSNLYMLLKSGVSPSLSFDMMKPLMNNVYFLEQLEKGRLKLQEGQEMSEVLTDLSVFPGVVMPLFTVAQETGHTEKMLERISKLMNEESQKQLSQITTVVEPILMIILSILMGVILISSVLPVIEILNGIG